MFSFPRIIPARSAEKKCSTALLSVPHAKGRCRGTTVFSVKNAAAAFSKTSPCALNASANCPSTRLRAARSSTGRNRRLVRRFKTGAKYLARTFARETEPVFRAEYDFSDFIVSVPMSGESLRGRGYNQSRAARGRTVGAAGDRAPRRGTRKDARYRRRRNF